MGFLNRSITSVSSPGIVNIALLGLSTLNLSAIAATPPTAVTQATTIDRIATHIPHFNFYDTY